MELREITAPETKSALCNQILCALPNWFGIPESIADYTEEVKPQPFYALFDQETPIGFVSLKIHNPHTAEIYVMGILKTHHRQGLGKKIINHCVNFCKEKNIEFLTVKTLDEKNPDVYYAKTRLFYQQMGFKPLEVFPLLWDECNPCLFMVKYIGAKNSTGCQPLASACSMEQTGEDTTRVV